MKQQYTICIFLFFSSIMNILPSLGGAGGGLLAQTWQWGERGGSADGTVGSGADEYPVDVAVDQNGNSYVLSYNVGKTSLSIGSQAVAKNFGSYDIMLASFNCSGHLRWVKMIGCKAEDRADALCVDKTGGVYIGFHSSLFSANTNDVYFDDDATITIPNTKPGKCYKNVFIAKYDTSGNFKWVTDPQPDTVGSYAISNTAIVDMEIDDKGDLHCLSILPHGIFENSYVVNKQGTYILKYNSNGTFLGGIAPDINVTAYSIGRAYLKRDNKHNRYVIAGTVEYLGPVYISGRELKASKYIAVFDNLGKLLWSHTDTAIGGNNGITNRPVIDELGNIYVVANTDKGDLFNGYVTSGTTSSTVMLMKMDKDGNNIWASNAQFTSAAIFSYGIALRNSGEVILTGANVGLTKWDTYGYGDSITTPDATYRPFIARFNTQTGKLLQMEDLVATGKNSYPLDIISDGRNGVYIGGELGGSLKINGASLSSVGGTKDFFVAKYGYAGCNCTDIPEPEFTQTVANHFNYSFTYTGTAGTTMEWDFGDGNTSTQTNPTHTYTSVGDFIACVKVTNSCGDNIYCTKISTKWPVAIGTIGDGSNIKIYPNPASDVLYMEGVEPGSRIELYNVLGIKAHEIITAKEKEAINISYLPAGNYIIQLTDKNGQRITGKVVKR